MHSKRSIGKAALLPSILALVSSLALTGCGGGEATPPSTTTGTPVAVGTPTPSPTPTPTPTPTPSGGQGSGQGTSQSDMLSVMVTRHNEARAERNIPRVTLDLALNEAALAYAEELASTDSFQHSAGDTRKGQGENLWAGTAGAFSFQQMVDAWIDEKQFFVAGRFPDISNTGNWQDVGHYTQIIWSDTDRIGCGLATSARRDYLVCRYAPAGNVVGQLVGG